MVSAAKKNSNYSYEYSLDVVTDGSEMTEPTVFLSVSRRSADSAPNNDVEMNGDVLARYAILGVSEMSARLVADQRLSWATTKAVFCHNNHLAKEVQPMEISGGGLWGLPGILFALRQAGAPELTVIAGNEDDASHIETMVSQQSSRNVNPHVRISAVPLGEHTTTAISWWKMYEDEYLIVHATCPAARLENLIYLFTCQKHKMTETYTVVVLPSSASRQAFLDIWKVPQNRVLLETETETENPSGSQENLSIQAMFLVGGGSRENQKLFASNAWAAFPETAIYACSPKIRDEGVLIRARKLGESWNKALPKDILCRHSSPSLQTKDPDSTIISDSYAAGENKIFYLASCSSVRCTQPPMLIDRLIAILKRIKQPDASPEDVKVVRSFFRRFDGRSPGDTEPTAPALPDENEIDIDDGDESDTVTCDDNEIDIGGSDTKEDTTVPDLSSRNDSPHLLVLGTGCAAPSTHRGSSGYGLMFPQQIYPQVCQQSPPQEALLLTAIIECGEGVLSMLLRHLPPVAATKNELECLHYHLCHVKFIWISHAHFDHYGGLPSVVQTIHQCRKKQREQELSSRREKDANKRPKLDDSGEPPLLIIAPAVVLQYLDNALRCRTGVKKRNGSSSAPVRLFEGFTHEQHVSWWPALSSLQILRVRQSKQNKTNSPTTGSEVSDVFAYRPFAFWNNVRVDHSCFCAFGFVMGLRLPSPGYAGDYCSVSLHPSHQMDSPVVTFAYSGDTRPCWRLVQQCRVDCTASSRRRLDYLLHEASFDDDEQAMSLAKKHSSLSEAFKVASDTNTANIVLTHFSQRYASYPPMKLSAVQQQEAKAQNRAVLFALDGMLIPLKN